MNALNVGRIKLAAACLDAQRRVISNSVKYANEEYNLIRLLQSLELSVLN
jgi:alkylation response protein AidB-like acyl-CoA dehydrogenase